MTATVASSGWHKGRVKSVPSGDTLVIMAAQKSDLSPPPEKTITLSYIIAPKLVCYYPSSLGFGRLSLSLFSCSFSNCVIPFYVPP